METDEWIDEDYVAAQRGTARNLLTPIIQQVKQGLKEAGIDMEVFLMIPASGDALATFGTVSDPPDELWGRVSEIVCGIVGRAVGLDRAVCRELACATTADQSAHLTSADLTAEPIPVLTPMPTSATGAETR